MLLTFLSAHLIQALIGGIGFGLGFAVRDEIVKVTKDWKHTIEKNIEEHRFFLFNEEMIYKNQWRARQIKSRFNSLFPKTAST